MRVRVVRLAVVGVVACCAVGTGTAFAEAPVWTVSAAAAPHAAAQHYQLPNDVDCPSADMCVLVGSYDTFAADPGVYLDTVRHGRSQAVIKAPLPADALGAPSATSQSVEAVSCVSDDSCVAVGQYTDQQDDEAGFIDTLTDGQWTAQRAPLDPGAGLAAIGCNAEQCVAASDRVGAPVIVRGSDGLWRSSPVMAQHQGAVVVDQVSCPPSGSCVLNARQKPNTINERPVLGVYDGTRFQAQEFPFPAQAKGYPRTVNSLSCPQDGQCVAFGTDEDHNTLASHPVVETYAGGTLSVQTLPAPDGYGAHHVLYAASVSCASAQRCAGFVYGGDGSVLYHSVGGRWAYDTAPELLSPGATSCSAFGACVIAAADGDQPSLLTLVGGQWQQYQPSLPVTKPASNSGELTMVSCAGRHCLAAGSLQDTHHQKTASTMLAAGRSVPKG